MLFKKINTQIKGLTLVELFMIIIIGSACVFAGMVAYDNIAKHILTTRTTQLIDTLKKETQNLYRNDNSYGMSNTDITKTVINATRAENKEIALIDGFIKSPYGTKVTIKSNGKTFMISIYDLTKNDCVTIGSAYTTDVISMYINHLDTLAIDEDVIKACLLNTPNEISWEFL